MFLIDRQRGVVILSERPTTSVLSIMTSYALIGEPQKVSVYPANPGGAGERGKKKRKKLSALAIISKAASVYLVGRLKGAWWFLGVGTYVDILGLHLEIITREVCRKRGACIQRYQYNTRRMATATADKVPTRDMYSTCC